MTLKETYTLNELVNDGILPYSWRTLRRMIARGELNAQVFMFGKAPRYVVNRDEVARLIGLVKMGRPTFQRSPVINNQDTASQLETK